MARRKEPRYKKIFGLIYLMISAILIYTLVGTAYRVLGQKQELAQLQQQKEELQQEKEALEEEVDLLSDDDYAARYARDNYIFPKDDEEVVVLPDTDE